jgi:hypothetical protein
MKIKKFLFYQELEITPNEVRSIIDVLPKEFSVLFLKWLENFLKVRK